MKRQTLVADRYGKAFFQVAADQKLLDVVEGDFKKLSDLIRDDHEFSQTLKNPLVSQKEWSAVFQALQKHAKLNDLSLRFLQVLASKDRTGFLDEIIAVFNKMVRTDRNQLIVNVTSKSPLAKETQKQLKSLLSTKMGKDIILNLAEQDDLLGGIVIKYDSYTLDFSLKSKLAELKQELERLA